MIKDTNKPEPAKPGTKARHDQIEAEMAALQKEFDSVFAAANPKAFQDKRKQYEALEEELETYYDDF